MAICIRHGLKARSLDRRRVVDDRPEGPVPILVDIIECRLCAAEDGDDGIRQLETTDTGAAVRRYVKAPRLPGPVRHGKLPPRLRPRRKHYRGRTGGETTLSPHRHEA